MRDTYKLQYDFVYPTDILAPIYHTLGIPADTIIYNHLNQPRELVKGKVVAGLFS